MAEYVTYEEFCLGLPGEERPREGKGPANWWASLSEEEKEVEREKRRRGGLRRWEGADELKREEHGRLTREGQDNPQTRWAQSRNTTRRNKEWMAEGIHPFQREENKELTGRISRDFWKSEGNEEEKQERIRKILQNAEKTNNGKTYTEGLLEVLLEEWFPGEWRYNDQCWFVLGRRAPDFVNINGQKKLIEIFGEYWHEEEEIEERIQYFRQFGFETLVLWDSQVWGSEGQARIKSFCSREGGAPS